MVIEDGAPTRAMLRPTSMSSLIPVAPRICIWRHHRSRFASRRPSHLHACPRERQSPRASVPARAAGSVAGRSRSAPHSGRPRRRRLFNRAPSELYRSAKRAVLDRHPAGIGPDGNSSRSPESRRLSKNNTPFAPGRRAWRNEHRVIQAGGNLAATMPSNLKKHTFYQRPKVGFAHVAFGTQGWGIQRLSAPQPFPRPSISA